jgi:hypothetical protein
MKRVVLMAILLTASSIAEIQEIRLAGRNWLIDVAKLPMRSRDCESGTYPGCFAQAGAIAFDETHQTLYFYVETGTAMNRPFIVFSLDVKSNAVTRIITDYGAGARFGALSASGKYLAYVGYTVRGACGTDSFIGVIDIPEHRVATSPRGKMDAETRSRIEKLTWKTSSTINWEGSGHSVAECSKATGDQGTQRISGSLDIGKLKFHPNTPLFP